MSQPTAPVSLWAAGGYDLAEGARWVADRLVFVDLLSGRLFEVSGTEPAAPRLLADLPVPLGAVAPLRDRPGDWIVAAGTGIALLSAGGELEWLDRPEDGGSVETRMNDAVCDPAGRFWAGSMAYDQTEGAGSLYRTDTDGTVRKVLDGLTIVNGPTFDLNGTTLYFADTPTGKVFRASVDPETGELGEPEIFVRIPAEEGGPDGMVLDEEGFLWVALWGGNAIRKYAPDGTVAAHVPVPAEQPTSVCLVPGGGRLFVTTARVGLNNPPETSGAILSVEVASAGVPAQTFALRR
ncbi:MAG TPA: SMP-30/gluconolactonase/LRE family protein [Pseudonocardiaceae bacterium]|nr:SMP-30/gluconolactonase/LRE family protein [Pseudonocardiaceae bacterium]